MLNALPLHLLRDIFLAAFVAVPVSGVVGALLATSRRRRSAAAPPPATTGGSERKTSRRTFIKYGAAGVTTAAATAYGTSRWWPEIAQAAEDTCSVNLVINDGTVRMVDGTLVYMRGFGYAETGGPLVPGPPIGPARQVDVGQFPTITMGCRVTVTIENRLNDVHSFNIDDPIIGPLEIQTDDPTETHFPISIPPHSTRTVTFTPPRPGTYLYQDVLPGQRTLGLHGGMVVMPENDSTRPYVVTSGPPLPPGISLPEPCAFQFQYVWILCDIDPVWNGLAQNGVTLADPGDPTLPAGGIPAFLPRYFTINGASGGNALTDATENRRTAPHRHLDDATLIRIVNAGAAVHSCHFHGNHVFVLSENHAAPFTTDDGLAIALEKDVIPMGPEDVKDMLLPCHEPLDQYPPYDPNTAFENKYPMHCHAEMSQTAGGGNYPSGMLTDWVLQTEPERGPRPLGCSRC